MKRIFRGQPGAHINATETSDGQDYNGNKMRPGSYYVGKRNDDFRYIDKDGTEQWLVPCATYIADETILRGEAVSVSSRDQISAESLESDLPFVHKTDADVDKSCLGLAMNYAEKGQLVHVQNHGTFKFRTNLLADETYSDGVTKYSERELLLSPDTWRFRFVKGQRLFIAKATDEMPRGRFSFDFIDSVYRAKNTIQIGYLSDAPLNNDHTQEVWVELEVTGDTRGPLEHTQYLVELGEPFTITEEDEFRLFAIGQKHAEKPKFTISIPMNAYAKIKTNEAQQTFIGIRRAGDISLAKATILPLKNSLTVDSILENAGNPLDVGYVRFTTDHYFDAANPITRGDLEANVLDVVNIPNTYAEFLNALKDAMVAAFDATSDIRFDGTVNVETGEITFEGNQPSAYYELYLSQELASFGMQNTVHSHGSLETCGKAILADIRSEERSNVLGVYCGKGIGTHPAGETITIMRQGTFTLSHKQTCLELSSKIKNPEDRTEDDYTFRDGANYYLGVNGGVFRDFTHLYYDRIVKIGQQVGPNDVDGRILIDVGDVTRSYDGALPLGHIKPSVNGHAEFGFFLMDGETVYTKVDYQDFYNFLISTYPKADVEVNEFSFKIPECYSFINGERVFSQIKYLPNAMFNGMAQLIPFVRTRGVIENGKIQNFDISRLIQYGTLENGMVAPTLDNVEVHLYIKNAVGTGVEKLWREVDHGYHLFNNTMLYGYDWEVSESAENRFTLKMNIEDGIGLALPSGNAAPKSLEGKEYMLVVTRRDIWKRQYQDVNEIGASFITKFMDADSDDLAPTVNAVKAFYKALVETNHLKVGDFLDAENKTINIDGTTITIDGFLKIEPDVDEHGNDIFVFKAYNPATETYESYLFENDLKVHADKTISEGVHGIDNNGATGNINANKLAGYQVGTSNGAVTENKPQNEGSYIPYVNGQGELNIGPTTNFGSSGISETAAKSGEQSSKTTISPTEQFVQTYKLSNGNELNVVYDIVNGIVKFNKVEVNTATNKNLTVTNRADIKALYIDGQPLADFIDAKITSFNEEQLSAQIEQMVQNAIPDHSNYLTQDDLDGYAKTADLENLASKEYVEEQAQAHAAEVIEAVNVAAAEKEEQLKTEISAILDSKIQEVTTPLLQTIAELTARIDALENPSSSEGD